MSWPLRGYRIADKRGKKSDMRALALIIISITHRTVKKIFNNPNFVLKTKLACILKTRITHA